jgi:hypothetical protein
MDLAPRAKKLIQQHSKVIDTAAQEAVRKLTSSTSVLSAVCGLLNLRACYFGATGEHFSVHEYNGIQVIDVLDERLLKAVRVLLQQYVDRARRKPKAEARKFLKEKLSPGIGEIPQYPVGYLVYYMLQSALQSFSPIVEGGHGFQTPVLETAMIHHLLNVLKRYVQTREKPVVRHFSDVAREYSVVMRLKCDCGAEKFDVRLQALCQTASGEPFDRLDLDCQACGSQRTITFDLPHFRDMYKT